MTFPRNEAETIALFKLCQHRFGWQIIHLQTAFPDAIIENEQGKQLVAEFEFDSKNFYAHGHDPDGCDIIIAYTDSWENPPVPVWVLKDCTKEETKIIGDVIGFSVPAQIYLEVCQENIERGNEILRLKKQPEKMPRSSGALKTIPIFAKERYIPIPIQSPAKEDWILALSYFVLGIGFWALHPLIFNLMGI